MKRAAVIRSGLAALLLATFIAGTHASADRLAAWQDDTVRRVWLGEPRSENGEVVVPVEVDDLAQVVAIDLNLVFDPAAFAVLDVRTTGLLDGFFAIHNVVEDTLKVAIASAVPAEGGGTFLEIHVEGDGPVAFGIAEVVFNGNLIPVEYERAGGEETPSDSTAVNESNVLPTAFRLKQNFPNPFNAETTIEYSLPESSRVRLEVFDVVGRRVRVLVDGERPMGVHRVVWDGRDGAGKEVASGRFVARLTAGRLREEVGMVLVR